MEPGNRNYYRVTVPVMHPKNYGIASLRKKFQGACTAGEKFLTALAETSPNRSHYRELGAYEKAREEHERRVELTEQVMTEIREMWQGVENQSTE